MVISLLEIKLLPRLNLNNIRDKVTCTIQTSDSSVSGTKSSLFDKREEVEPKANKLRLNSVANQCVVFAVFSSDALRLFVRTLRHT